MCRSDSLLSVNSLVYSFKSKRNTSALSQRAFSSSAVCSFERSDSAEEASHQCQPQQWPSGWSINLRQQQTGLRSDWRLGRCLTVPEISF